MANNLQPWIDPSKFTPGMTPDQIAAEASRQREEYYAKQRAGAIAGAPSTYDNVMAAGGNPLGMMAAFYNVPFYTRDPGYGAVGSHGVVVQPGTPFQGPDYLGKVGAATMAGGAANSSSNASSSISSKSSGSKNTTVGLPQWWKDWYNTEGIKGGSPVAGLLG